MIAVAISCRGAICVGQEAMRVGGGGGGAGGGRSDELELARQRARRNRELLAGLLQHHHGGVWSGRLVLFAPQTGLALDGSAIGGGGRAGPWVGPQRAMTSYATLTLYSHLVCR